MMTNLFKIIPTSRETPPFSRVLESYQLRAAKDQLVAKVEADHASEGTVLFKLGIAITASVVHLVTSPQVK